MGMISAKFNDEESDKLNQICDTLRIDKSEALRRATQQLWLALQIGKPFLERAGGRPQFLLKSGNPKASSREYRKREAAAHLDERAKKRKESASALPDKPEQC